MQIYIRDLTKDWTQIACLAVSHSNHYIGMFFFCLCETVIECYSWTGDFVQITRWKTLHFEKKLAWIVTQYPVAIPKIIQTLQTKKICIFTNTPQKWHVIYQLSFPNSTFTLVISVFVRMEWNNLILAVTGV